jgi:uncharacterized protein
MIIDCHVHIHNAEDAHLGRLLHFADRAGVDRLCISSLSRTWKYDPDEAALEEAAGDVLDACRKHPDRFTGFVYVSADHVEKSLDLIERCAANGPCRCIKLWVSQFADDPRLDPIMHRAIELRLGVMMHSWIKATGNLPKETTVYHAVRLAQRHPDLRCWMAHCSGRWEEAARIAAPYPNLCMDVSGGEPEAGMVECLLAHVAPERIFWGSDAPGRSFAVQMAKVKGARIPESHKKMILGDNIRRWIDD